MLKDKNLNSVYVFIPENVAGHKFHNIIAVYLKLIKPEIYTHITVMPQKLANLFRVYLQLKISVATSSYTPKPILIFMQCYNIYCVTVFVLGTGHGR